jgi:hypothetical protein
MQPMASLFVGLRDDFPDFLDDARKRGESAPHWHCLAQVGFSLTCPDGLDDADSLYIEGLLNRWHPLTAPEHAFAALALGAILGKVEDNILSEFDLIVMQAELRQFLDENTELLEARWTEGKPQSTP